MAYDYTKANWSTQARVGSWVKLNIDYAVYGIDGETVIPAGTVGLVTWSAEKAGPGRDVKLADGKEINIAAQWLTRAPAPRVDRAAWIGGTK